MRITLLFVIFLILFATNVLGDVQINEVAVEKTPQAIELINTASVSADISNWYVDDNGGTTYFTIPQNTILYPNSCIVFEGDFNLNKSTPDSVRLFDSKAPPNGTNAFLVDSCSYKTGPGTGNSYVRIPDGGSNWITATSSMGLYNETGISCIITPTLTPTPPPSPTPIPSIIPSPVTTISASPTVTSAPLYEHIYINEVYPYPNSGEKEWVELINNNDFDVRLENWFIDDSENAGGTPKRFSAALSARGYAVVELTSSLLNNDEDSVRLLNQDYAQIDGFEYTKPRQGKSLGRISFETESVCIEDPSRGNPNTSCVENTLTKLPNEAVTTNPAAKTVINAVNSEPLNIRTKIDGNLITDSRPTVLGETTVIPEKKVTHNRKGLKPIRNLAFVSFSYSILTIISVLIKIRNGLAA